ncbi:hypothetical protein J6590_013268 [Homalodisca vitripennis]|nr:hypothetical protein J6590_013268 [Homalodisca vitripennis]
MATGRRLRCSFTQLWLKRSRYLISHLFQEHDPNTCCPLLGPARPSKPERIIAPEPNPAIDLDARLSSYLLGMELDTRPERAGIRYLPVSDKAISITPSDANFYNNSHYKGRKSERQAGFYPVRNWFVSLNGMGPDGIFGGTRTQSSSYSLEWNLILDQNGTYLCNRNPITNIHVRASLRYSLVSDKAISITPSDGRCRGTADKDTICVRQRKTLRVLQFARINQRSRFNISAFNKRFGIDPPYHEICGIANFMAMYILCNFNNPSDLRTSDKIENIWGKYTCRASRELSIHETPSKQGLRLRVNYKDCN